MVHGTWRAKNFPHGTLAHVSRGEDFLALRAQLALRPNVLVERHGPDPEFAAECGHGGVTVGHRGLGGRRERRTRSRGRCGRRRRLQRVALQVQRLGAIRLRDAGGADQHVS